MVLLSWIIPAYNESLIIQDVLERLYQEYIGLDLEIIVADDGSIDNTKQIASDFFQKYNCGKIVASLHAGRGGALLNGIHTSTGNILVLSAADIILERKLVEEIIQKAKEYDLILLSKNLPSSKVVGRSFSREVLSRTFNLFVRLIFGLPFKDTQGLKIVKRDALLEILKYTHDKGFVMDLELVVFATKLGYRILELPWHLEFRAGTKTVVKNIDKMLLNVIRLRLEIARSNFSRHDKYAQTKIRHA